MTEPTVCRRPDCPDPVGDRQLTRHRQSLPDAPLGPFCDRHTDMLIANLTPGTYTVTTSEQP